MKCRIFSRDEKARRFLRKRFYPKLKKFLHWDVPTIIVKCADCNSWVDYIFPMAGSAEQVPFCEFSSYGGVRQMWWDRETYSTPQYKMKWSVWCVLSTDIAVVSLLMRWASKAMMEKVHGGEVREIVIPIRQYFGYTALAPWWHHVVPLFFVCWYKFVLVSFDRLLIQTWRALWWP